MTHAEYLRARRANDPTYRAAEAARNRARRRDPAYRRYDNTRKTLRRRHALTLYDAASGRCDYCGRATPLEVGHVEHAVPWSRGGSNDIGNLRWSCAPCNRAKGDRTEAEWRAA